MRITTAKQWVHKRKNLENPFQVLVFPNLLLSQAIRNISHGGMEKLICSSKIELIRSQLKLDCTTCRMSEIAKGGFLLSPQGVSPSPNASKIHSEQTFPYKMLLKDKFIEKRRI